MAGKSDRLGNPNEPFGRIVLIPLDGVTIIHRELMVEVVVTFANSGKSSDNVVAGSVLVIERTIPEPVRKRVHTESRLNKVH